jgi:hypothetical protein
MKRILFLLALVCLEKTLHAQTPHTPYIYTIKADSVKITNTCDTAELIIENHTQTVPGFLFNKGRGRTEFRRALQKVSDSVYVIGGDSLKMSNMWLQGGNAFGSTGILGTKDNNHLDLYTNDSFRIRVSKWGNFLIGTTVDDGHILNVNGKSNFSGDVNIGSATITNAGNLIGTNAILFNHFISQYHSYMQNDPFISKLDNILYDYRNRFATTTSTGADGSLNINIIIPPDEFDYNVIGTDTGVVYPQGNMYFSFWNDGVPKSVTVRMRSKNGWQAPYTSNTNLAPNGPGFFKVPIGASFNFLREIAITITPAQPGGFVNLTNVEYVLDAGPQGLISPFPFLSKYGNEYLYYFLSFKSGGKTNARISPFLGYPNYFINNTMIGTSADNGNKLQVAGNTSMTGNLTVAGNGIAFPGLASNNSANRILAGDANGNLYYRDASSLALNGTLNSDLAVNGTVSAQKMLITQTGRWPDYVFSKQYQLPSLAEVENYINQNSHLPGIPAAADIEKKGIDVAGNQVALLKKIEELTLYIIKQDKTIQKQNDQIKDLLSLKQEMAELKALIKNSTQPVK